MSTEKICLALMSFAVFAVTAMAQAPNQVFIAGGPGLPPPPMAGAVTLRISDADDIAVKNAPFCATITTEHTQLFADGNRIHTTDDSTLCRDGEGRTRREAGLNLLGAAPQTSTPKLITITDPVAGVRYMLDPEQKIAHKFLLTAPEAAGKGGLNLAIPQKDQHMVIAQQMGAEGPEMTVNNDVFFKSTDKVFFKSTVKAANEPAPVTENLGDQNFDGIHAVGTRLTTTIPAGQMGNEQPMHVTSERWYSPELKVTVMTKHDDPWSGELKTELKDANTSEPDPALFRVPADYKIVEDNAGPFVLQKIAAPPAAPAPQ